MAGEFAGKSILITGGASGIGRATALAFAQAGAKVAIVDVSEAGATATVQEIERAGGTATFIPCDVTNAAQVEAMVKRTVEAYGRLDCAFNNAGVGGALATTDKYPEDDWHKVIAVNLTGVFLCLKYELQQMKTQGSGTIVNTASAAGLVGAGGLSAYDASKHGVVGLTKTAALENAKRGIRVNAVCPGWVETPMLGNLGSENAKFQEGITRFHPVGRLGTPEEVAQAVLWLCSDGASFVTGTCLSVDGGLTAQ